MWKRGTLIFSALSKMQVRLSAGAALLCAYIGMMVSLLIWIWIAGAPTRPDGLVDTDNLVNDFPAVVYELPAGSAASIDAVLVFLAESAKRVGLVWVSVNVGDDTTGGREAPNVDFWRVEVKLQGGYPETKRWLREVTTRYPNLALSEARWWRNAVQVGAYQGGNQVEAQFQLVWLQRAVQSPPSGLARAVD